MLKTEQLGQYLADYHALPLHNDQQLKAMTLKIIEWQQNRMKKMYRNIFDAMPYSIIQTFFLNHFYSFSALELLAQQLKQALDEKIKLDRWLPNEILDTILNGFKLALITLESDSQLAELLLQEHLDLNDENLLTVLPQAAQTEIRQQQLELLDEVSKKMLKFSHSFLFRSALRLAKPKIEQRGFSELNRYIEDGLKAMRSHKKSQHFFQHLIYQEKLFLDYLTIHHPSQLDIYYDADAKCIKSLTSVLK